MIKELFSIFRKFVARKIYPEFIVDPETFEKLRKDMAEGHLSREEKEMIDDLERRVGR